MTDVQHQQNCGDASQERFVLDIRLYGDDVVAVAFKAGAKRRP
jgi:hypothetical protein